MKKAKRVLALILAFVMISSVFMTESFAKTANENYNAFKTDPTSFFNGVDKIEFTAGQGAAYILDLLDVMLKGADINMDVDLSILGTLGIRLRNIDEALYTLYNLIGGVRNGGDTDLLKNVGISGSGVASLATFGDISGLTETSIANPNNMASARLRGVPQIHTYKNERTTAVSDIDVLKQVTGFLSDNRVILSKVVGTPAGSKIDLTIKGKGILGAIKIDLYNMVDALKTGTANKLLTNFLGFLKDLLYTKLFDDSVETAPANWSYDGGVQQLINWLLIEGTGTTAATGGNSVLGENFEPFLPAIANYPHGASIGNDSSFYQLVNNALNALLSGFLGEKLEGLLVDLLDIDTSEDPRGNQAVMGEMLFSLLAGTGTNTGLIEDLCHQNGAPSIDWASDTDAQQYPIPRIQKLLDWFFNGGGLDTFIHIDNLGIHVTDAFVQLLRDVLGILPTVVLPLLDFDYPEGLIHSVEELSEKKVDEVKGSIWTNIKLEEMYFDEDDSCYKYFVAYPELGIAKDSDVNDSNPSGSNYRNPQFFREANVVPVDAVWADILKVVLNNFVEGCYFPEWADTIAEVGAYALASLAQQYLPENNYFDRLDKYHWVHDLGNSAASYTNMGASSDVDPLAYTETMTVKDKNNQNKTVIFPRAAADIGASLGAFFLNGAFDFYGALGYWPETDTTFEAYLTEFLMWGIIKYMPLFCGKYNSQTHQFGAFSSGATGTWQSNINSALSAFNALRTNANVYERNGVMVNRMDTSAVANIIYPLIDNTLFKLIDATWLPDWLATGKSKSLFCYWLGDSLIDIDLQQIFDLFQVNTSSNAELAKPVTVVLLRLIDRILGTLFGGNAVLPSTTDSTSDRNVFNTPTTLTTLDGFLGSNATFVALFKSLLFFLNRYIEPLSSTIFPLLLQFLMPIVKDKTYPTDYIGTKKVTVEELQEYIDYYNGEINSYDFGSLDNNGRWLSYETSKEANDVAEAMEFDSSTSTRVYNVNGVDVYQVQFPATYNRLTLADKAAGYISENLGEPTHVSNERVNGRRVYKVMIDVDYKSATADMTKVPVMENGREVDREYQYTNFHRAMPIARSAANKGIVTYNTEVNNEPVYYLIEREDFTTGNIKYLNRRNNAVEDAEEFLSDREKFITGDLSGGYGSWLMYIINCDLTVAGYYDKNDDGTVVARTNVDASNYDGYPNQPGDSTVYPFYNSSGSAGEYYVDGSNNISTKSYSFAASAESASSLIASAVEYANEVDEETGERLHDVKLGQTDTESVVRLAISSINFEIDKRHSGNKISWADLTAGQRTNITNKCAEYGLTFHYDAENPADSYITRPAFALLTGTRSIEIGRNITRDDNDNITKNEAKTLSLQPVSMPAKDADSSVKDLHDSYIAFAKKLEEFDTGIAKHYDDISWRASLTDSGMRSQNVTDPLDWVLNYTYKGIYPNNNETRRNLTYNTETDRNEPKYSKTSFENFQKAYDYGVWLRKAIKQQNVTVAQSLISTVCKDIMKTYAALELYGGAANWAPLNTQITYADNILYSGLGIDRNSLPNIVLNNPTSGYTSETLSNLYTALQYALQYKATNEAVLDSDGDEEIAAEARKLEKVIAALRFVPGVEIAVVSNPEYVADPDNTVRPLTNSLKDGTMTVGIIYGFEEGIGFTENLKETAISPTGFTVNDGNGTFKYQPSARGNGTGSLVLGQRGSDPVVRYTAVVVGDINGDARIDGNDKTAVEVFIRTNKSFANITTTTDGVTTTTPSTDGYLAFASDTNGDGNIDLEDIAKIKAHYQYRDVDPNEVEIDGFTYNGNVVDGTISQTGLATANLENPPAVRND